MTCLIIVADQVNPFMATVYHRLMATSSILMRQVTSNCFHEHDRVLQWLSPAEHFWDVVEWEI